MIEEDFYNWKSKNLFYLRTKFIKEYDEVFEIFCQTEYEVNRGFD